MSTSESPTIQPIRTESDYEAALVRIEALMDAEPDTPAADELEVLAMHVELYENEHYPMAISLSI
jgi:HTH-type transcriptional regulator/antitoxin HigA